MQILALILKLLDTGLDLTSKDVSLLDVNNMGTIVELCKVMGSSAVPKIQAVLEMAPISPDNFNPDIPSTELSMLPEWHCKKWAMAIVNRVNGNVLS